MLIGAVLLAGCGDTEDFAIDVAMTPDRAAAELAALDGGMALRALPLPLVMADSSVRNELAFALPGDDEPGRLHLRFEENGTQMTRIRVALSLASNVEQVQGKLMVLSEDKAEALVQRRMADWAQRIGSSGHASLEPLNEALAGLSISLRPGKLNEVLAAANDPTKLAGLLDPEILAEMEGADGSEYLADAGDLGEPMLDPESDIAAASQPMDDAQGEDPGGWSSEAY